jgi:menaquinol-cytochrome c reductase iron-sulfur subunit
LPADRHKRSSRYTPDRAPAGALEAEPVTRRRFVTGSAQAAGGLAAAGFTLPALGFTLGPIFKRAPFHWQIIGTPTDFSQVSYVTKRLAIVDAVGEAGRSIAYVRRRNPAIDTEPQDQFNRYIALSSRCMHLGCPVRYVPGAERFECPCHGGVYNLRGEVAGGPAVRPLDRFYTLERAGYVYLGPRYSVSSELQRFSLRAPGEPLDGFGRYLYPPRPETTKLPPTDYLSTPRALPIS